MHSRTIDRIRFQHPPLSWRAACFTWLMATCALWAVIVVIFELLHGI